jgi:hypothetical protein
MQDFIANLNDLAVRGHSVPFRAMRDAQPSTLLGFVVLAKFRGIFKM